MGVLSLAGCGGDDDGDPYANYTQINTADDLGKIGNDAAYPLNGKYMLADDITLTTWTPIGSDTQPFTGALYGNSKTIILRSFYSGAATARYLGVFAYVNGATISDLVVMPGALSRSSTAASPIYVGVVAGYAKDSKLRNITVSSGSLTFSANAVVSVGGIIGCGVDSEITNSKVSTRSISVTGNGNSGAGGIAGSIKSSAALRAKVRNSSSTGSVTLRWRDGSIPGSTDYGMLYVGGIAGDSAFSSETPYYGGLFENCYSTGAVTCASVGYPYAGGIVGYSYASSQIKACYATGAISATATAMGTGYVGGIAGTNSNTSTIENSYTKGNVRLTGPGHVGGIAGQNGVNGSIVQYCYATGTITSNTAAANVGGIVGQNYNSEGTEVKENAALNARITVVASTTYAHRVVGMQGGISWETGALENNLVKMTNNIANIANTTNIVLGEISANSADGADSAAKPAWTAYSAMGWSGAAWKTALGADGYPELAWQ
jgi:hypothetical protein